LNKEEADGRAEEALLKLLHNAAVGLRTDDPELVLDREEILELAGGGFEHPANIVAALYAMSAWLAARLRLLGTVLQGTAGGSGIAMLVAVGWDRALADANRQLAHTVADDIAGSRSQHLVEELDSTGTYLLALTDEIEARALFARFLSQQPGLSSELRVMALLGAPDDVLAEGIIDAVALPGALEDLRSPEFSSSIVDRLRRVGAEERFAEQLVLLRPTSVEDLNGQLELLDLLLERTTWRPAAGALADVIEYMRVMSPESSSMAVSDLLRGAAITSVKSNRPRSAALWSLASFAERPTLDAAARVLHESCTANAIELLREGLALAIPVDAGSVDTDSVIDFFMALTRALTIVGHEPKWRRRIADLGAAAAEAGGEAAARADAYEELQTYLHERDNERRWKEDLEYALFAAAISGVGEALARRFPYNEFEDFEPIGDQWQLGGPALWKRAWEMAYTRRIGPHDLLTLADCAIEMGDLYTANNLIDDAEGAYPGTVAVLVSRIKLSIGAARQSETRRHVAALISLLRDHRDDVSTGDIARAFMTLPLGFLIEARDVVHACLEDPRLADAKPLIEARLAGE
jgi:hypothetical protein